VSGVCDTEFDVSIVRADRVTGVAIGVEEGSLCRERGNPFAGNVDEDGFMQLVRAGRGGLPFARGRRCT